MVHQVFARVFLKPQIPWSIPGKCLLSQLMQMFCNLKLFFGICCLLLWFCSTFCLCTANSRCWSTMEFWRWLLTLFHDKQNINPHGTYLQGTFFLYVEQSYWVECGHLPSWLKKQQTNITRSFQFLTQHAQQSILHWLKIVPSRNLEWRLERRSLLLKSYWYWSLLVHCFTTEPKDTFTLNAVYWGS